MYFWKFSSINLEVRAICRYAWKQTDSFHFLIQYTPQSSGDGNIFHIWLFANYGPPYLLCHWEVGWGLVHDLAGWFFSPLALAVIVGQVKQQFHWSLCKIISESEKLHRMLGHYFHKNDTWTSHEPREKMFFSVSNFHQRFAFSASANLLCKYYFGIILL